MAEKAKKDDGFYVEVDDSVSVRRNLLESSKELLSALEMYERFKETRKEKTEAIERFKKSINEAYRLIAKLNAALPKVKLKKRKEAKEHAEPENEEEEIKPEMSELQKLEKELSEVEKKLERLS